MSKAAEEGGRETIEQMAEKLRQAFASGYLNGMYGPVAMFANPVECRYVPPRSTDGWFDSKVLYEYQAVEERILRSVVPDANFAEVQVLTRADDQIVCIYVMRGHTVKGELYELPVTFVYDVKESEIVRATGLYDQERLRPFAAAFAAAAATSHLPIEMAPRDAERADKGMNACA